jgi:hypothetical protein
MSFFQNVFMVFLNSPLLRNAQKSHKINKNIYTKKERYIPSTLFSGYLPAARYMSLSVFFLKRPSAFNKRTHKQQGGTKKWGGTGGLFAREARGIQVVRGVNLKGPKPAGLVAGVHSS